MLETPHPQTERHPDATHQPDVPYHPASILIASPSQPKGKFPARKQVLECRREGKLLRSRQGLPVTMKSCKAWVM